MGLHLSPSCQLHLQKHLLTCPLLVSSQLPVPKRQPILQLQDTHPAPSQEYQTLHLHQASLRPSPVLRLLESIPPRHLAITVNAGRPAHRRRRESQRPAGPPCQCCCKWALEAVFPAAAAPSTSTPAASRRVQPTPTAPQTTTVAQLLDLRPAPQATASAVIAPPGHQHQALATAAASRSVLWHMPLPFVSAISSHTCAAFNLWSLLEPVKLMRNW